MSRAVIPGRDRHPSPLPAAGSGCGAAHYRSQDPRWHRWCTVWGLVQRPTSRARGRCASRVVCAFLRPCSRTPFRLSNVSLREVRNPVYERPRTVWTIPRQAPRHDDPAILRIDPW